MATKTAKTHNSDRKSGKAWGRNHVATAKTLSPEAQARKAHKDAERVKKAPVSHVRGSNITMPKFTWEWAAEAMSGTRLTHTRRFRMVEACLERERRGDKS
jgi:hypothetical protein